jgi:hypothetical protein
LPYNYYPKAGGSSRTEDEDLRSARRRSRISWTSLSEIRKTLRESASSPPAI